MIVPRILAKSVFSFNVWKRPDNDALPEDCKFQVKPDEIVFVVDVIPQRFERFCWVQFLSRKGIGWVRLYNDLPQLSELL